jgi:hypothetical protein
MHVAVSDDFDTPGTTTLCGRHYDPADRTYAKKTKKATGAECRPCLKVIQKAREGVYAVQIALGRSEQRATEITDQLFEMDRLVTPPRA